MSSINSTSSLNQPEWNNVLETPTSLKNYLKKRVETLTDELKDIQPQYEKTHVGHRMKWIAQIIYHAVRAIVYGLGKVFTKMIQSPTLFRKCSVQFFDAGTRLYSRAKALSCHQELLIKTHNGPDLSRSNLAYYQNLVYDGRPFDASNLEGNCAGTQGLFTLLFLKGKEKFPEMNSGDLIKKITQLLNNGAHPEASIMQALPELERELFCEMFEECHNLSQIEPDKREPSYTYVFKSETKGDNPPSVETLLKLDLDRPYFLTTRTSITGNCHASLVIRTGKEEFYWFDSARGLTFFSGRDKIKKLAQLWDYGPLTKGEKEYQKNCAEYVKQVNAICDDFLEQRFTPDQMSLIKQVEERIGQGMVFEDVIEGVKEENPDILRLLNECSEYRKRAQTILLKAHACPPLGVILTPYSDELIN